MKKSTGILAVVGALAVLGASCSFAGVGEIKKIPETYLTMAVGSSGGGWYIMGAGLNEGWESQIPGLKMTLVPGGGASNPTLANNGSKVQIGFTYVSNAAAACNGERNHLHRPTLRDPRLREALGGPSDGETDEGLSALVAEGFEAGRRRVS